MGWMGWLGSIMTRVVRVRWRLVSREYMATAFLVLTVFATVVDKHGRHADSGVKVSPLLSLPPWPSKHVLPSA